MPDGQENVSEALEKLKKEVAALKEKAGVVEITERICNPAPLGLAAFGMTTLVLNAFNSGLVDKASEGLVWPLGIFFGGMAQFAAGMWEAKKNNTFGFTAFASFGAFWMFLALTKILQNTGAIEKVQPEGASLFLVCWGLFTGYMFVGTLKISRALQAVFGTLTILFFLLAIGAHDGTWEKIAGWEGMICAGTALYASFAMIVNETWGRQVFPLGVIKK
jgi:succinate-acetate transporter protein